MISVEDFLLRKWPYSGEVCLVALIFTGCLKTRKADPQKKWHPLHDFVHTFLNTFATGVLGPLLVGEVPLPLTNDVIFTLLLAIWYLFYRFDYIFVPFASTTGIFQALVFFATLSRANNVCIFTDKAFKRLKAAGAKSLYPIPLAGPIITGTVRGAGGLFFPFDKGLGGLKSGLPFNAQIALVCSALWHLAVNDDFILGGLVRGAISSVTLGRGGGAAGAPIRPDTLKCAIVVFFLIMNVVQSFSAYSTVNPFYYIWEVLYYTTGVTRSPGTAPPRAPQSFKGLYELKGRIQKQHVFTAGKIIFISSMFGLYVHNQQPIGELYSGQSLKAGQYMGTCTLLPKLRSCTPTIAVMEDTGRLAVYQAASPTAKDKKLLWASTAAKKGASAGAQWEAKVQEDGTLAVQQQHPSDPKKAATVAWKSTLSSAAKKQRQFQVKAVLEAGALKTYRAGEVAWSSVTA